MWLTWCSTWLNVKCEMSSVSYWRIEYISCHMTVQWLTWDSVCLVHCGSWVLVQPMAVILYSIFNMCKRWCFRSYFNSASEPKLNLFFNEPNVKCQMWLNVKCEMSSVSYLRIEYISSKLTVQWLTWDSACLVHCGSWVLVQPMAMILYSKIWTKRRSILCYRTIYLMLC